MQIVSQQHAVHEARGKRVARPGRISNADRKCIAMGPLRAFHCDGTTSAQLDDDACGAMGELRCRVFQGVAAGERQRLGFVDEKNAYGLNDLPYSGIPCVVRV